MRGRVKWFSAERGYGFITDEYHRDHHFAVQDVIGSALPTRGEKAEFDRGVGRHGAFARSVRVVASAPHNWGSRPLQDDRVVCRSCGRRIVPRVITYQAVLNGPCARSARTRIATSGQTYPSLGGLSDGFLSLQHASVPRRSLPSNIETYVSVALMDIARSNLTAQVQVLVPCEVPKTLDVRQEFVYRRNEDGQVALHGARRYTSEDIHQALFPERAPEKRLRDVKDAIRKFLHKRHLRG